MLINIKNLSFDEKINLVKALQDDLREYCSTHQLTYVQKRVLDYIYSPQKIAPWFEEQIINMLGYKKFKGSKYDAVDSNGDPIELKSYTVINGKMSCAQIHRRNIHPKRVGISVRFGKETWYCDIPGKDIPGSIIDKNSTSAHNGNQNERRINVKMGSPEEKWISGYRSSKTENLIKNYTYSPIS